MIVAWVTTFVVNLVPALMPPTWSIVAFFVVHDALPPLPLAFGCAVASTLGRTGLALMTRGVGPRLTTAAMRTNLDALALFLRERNRHVALGLLFMAPVSPFPSNQLFIAAGLARLDLKLIAPCFFVGRVVEYSAAALAADRAAATLTDLFAHHLSSAPALVIELMSLASIVLLGEIPWARVLRRWTRQSP